MSDSASRGGTGHPVPDHVAREATDDRTLEATFGFGLSHTREGRQDENRGNT